MTLDSAGTWAWIALLGGATAAIALDLTVLNRPDREPSAFAARVQTAVWVALALAFGAGVFAFDDSVTGWEYLSSYTIEKSLNLDLVFIWLAVFDYFALPPALQPRALRWGVFGAIVIRIALVAAGLVLLSLAPWLIFPMGALLLLTALRLAFFKKQTIAPERRPFFRMLARFVPIAHETTGDSFITRSNGAWQATPLLLTVILLQAADTVVAIDVLPAFYAVTKEPYVVFAANAFALVGLRGLYISLAGVVARAFLLREALAAILALVAIQLLISSVYKIPAEAMFLTVVGLLGIALAASWLNRAFRE